jgi:hypothetical protein
VSDSDREATHELVMPFVVCKTQGGPYDDEAFVGGVWFGQFDSLLHTAAKVGCDVTPHVAVPSPLVPQLDLLAMNHGYQLVAEEYEEDPAHSFVSFRQTTDTKENP